MTANEIREKFISFFENRGHQQIPSASLVPENDPTVLFTTAGMHPLVPYLLGEEQHPKGKRLVNFQKCIRTSDIEEVGDDVHLTFFEMLGNWSLGDYFKKEAIEMSFEFLTDSDEGLGIDKSMLAISYFQGDKEMGVKEDKESAEIWKSLGVAAERIKPLGVADNWWGPAGETGPCGPDTEMFYWAGTGDAPQEFDPADDNWIEIWNDVFMEYNKTRDGKYESLQQKNVDTGMGLERMAAALQGKKSVYETELFQPIIQKFHELAPEKNVFASRVVADHVRAAVFMIGDGVSPSNLDRGYILRRLLRRSVRQGIQVGAPKEVLSKLAVVVIEMFAAHYPKLAKNRDKIVGAIDREVGRFLSTLEKGMREFDKLIAKDRVDEMISGRDAFDLFQTYGFPLELTVEMASEKNIDVDEMGFWQEFEKHQEKSRTAAAGKFKGGLADHSEEVIHLHTTTHLLQAALRKVLGKHVYQKGSNITKERTRFDFSHPKSLTDEERNQVEDLVNQWINADLAVKKEIMTPVEAKDLGAIGLFDEKYEDEVSVYTIYDQESGDVISREFCGGPHVEKTGEIEGKFKIKMEQSAGSGVRRIKGILI